MTADSLEDMNSESPQESHIDDEQLKNLTLLEIEKLLHPNQRSLRDYPTMPYPEGGNPASCLKNSLILSELNYNNDEARSEFKNLFLSMTERQTCGRQRHSSRKHMWTLQLTQEMLDHPEPLSLLQPQDSLKAAWPPLQWKVETLNPAIGEKGVVQPWYDFLEEMNFDDGDEISIYYRYYEKIWDIIIRRQEDWEDDDSD
ncbi:hypothetical protein JHK85_048662 [Glycine max]|nr:hypothetical protein JHK85_048662 [Glycine max]